MADRLQDMLASYAVVIFDLDGVLVDSNEVKVSCLRATFATFPEDLVDEFADEFRRTFGRSRREHFMWFHARARQHGLTGTNAQNFFTVYAGAYADLLADHYPQAPLCAHAGRLVAALASRGVQLYVATGTLTAEANLVLKNLGLREPFRAVFGGEESKARRIARILEVSGVGPEQAVLIGDTRQDARAAAAAGCDFTLVTRYGFFPAEEVLQDRIECDDLIVADLDPNAPVPPRGRPALGPAEQRSRDGRLPKAPERT